ncbi:hypothetical protein E3G52_001019 [Mycobacteroides abscessus]|uniref:hypothetical protein n=1 Tax=Mycobacteroides abscessus TaxID=36809 RepID=UPI0018784B7C|nr:hypothetical protein [Mycobacteroides abscessus]MBE5454146.1 hypothetical protein [Mycobacteroides abscessus]
MADKKKPSDPYSLIGAGQWPAESESRYLDLETDMKDIGRVASEGSGTAKNDADDVEDNFKGRTGEASSGSLHGHYGSLDALSTDAVSFGEQFYAAAQQVGTTKSDIARIVREANPKIKTALDAEAEGKPTPDGKSSEALKTEYRAEIAATAADYATKMSAITAALTADPSAPAPAPRAARGTNDPGQRLGREMTPAQMTGLSRQLGLDPGQLPVPTQPDMPRALPPNTPSAQTPGHAPAPSVPVSPMGTGIPASGTPAASSAGETTSHSGEGTPVSQQNSTPGDHQVTPASHQEPSHREADRPHDRVPAGGVNVPLPDPTTLLASGAEAGAQLLGPALSASGAAQPPTTVTPSVVPASTGITPGIPGTAPGLAPMGPSAPATMVPSNPVMPSSPATPTAPGVQVPAGPAAQAPAPTAPSTPGSQPVTAAWLHERFGTPLPPSTETKTELTVPFLVGLDEEVAHLHTALATLRSQFEQAGWSGPLAVARITRGLEVRTVYATADALSLWPRDVRLPDGVEPLGQIPGIADGRGLLGALIPQAKFSLLPEDWEVEHVVSTVSGDTGQPVTVQSQDEHQAVVEAGEALHASRSRGDDTLTEDDVMPDFAMAVLSARSRTIDFDDDGSALRAARWVGVQPSGYTDILADWLLADAIASFTASRGGEAAYSLRQRAELAGRAAPSAA